MAEGLRLRGAPAAPSWLPGWIRDGWRVSSSETAPKAPIWRLSSDLVLPE